MDGESALGACGGRRAPTWTSGLGGYYKLPRACLKRACVDGLISGFGEQAYSCHSDAAGCGAERRGAGRHQAAEEGAYVLLGLLKRWGPVHCWVWGGRFGEVLASISLSQFLTH